MTLCFSLAALYVALQCRTHLDARLCEFVATVVHTQHFVPPTTKAILHIFH
jgi:hypothetical protein